ncbi:MAG: hypothetical protein WCK73_05640 [Deltaproteobacteria bacterium]
MGTFGARRGVAFLFLLAVVAVTDGGIASAQVSPGRKPAVRGGIEPVPRQAVEGFLNVATGEASRWASSLPRPARALPPLRAGSAPVSAAPVAGESWVSLGPTDARFQWNSSYYLQVDSGRATRILVDPRDPNVVYVATTGGGVWKTFDFETAAPNPTWQPITETIGNLAVGAMGLDPSNPDTIYLATGDPYDTFGTFVLKSVDGGGTWSAPIKLKASYPASAGGLVAEPLSSRDLKVDPKDPNVVFVTTDVGLFRSADAGASFALVDLPNSGPVQLAEATWDIVYLGAVGSRSRWILSGICACDPGKLPPWAKQSAQAGKKNPMDFSTCTYGTPGELWTSSDSGVTWAPIKQTNVGLVRLAAGPTTNPATTVVYALKSTLDGKATLGVFRSPNGGADWVGPVGTLVNPTIPVKKDPVPPETKSTSSNDCPDMNLGHDQSWFDLSIAVDPANADQVIAGGSLCGVRTLNGTDWNPTWENVSHWLPFYGGDTAAGRLPYVHADYQATLVSRVGGRLRTFAGTDGGVFSSTNLFNANTVPTDVVWNFHNRGMVTHLCYSVGSGDPATGNPFVVLTGLQDNGVRYRDSTLNPSTFNQVLGGDGIGAAVNTGTGGQFYWVAQQYEHLFCKPEKDDCWAGGSWTKSNPPLIDTGNPDEEDTQPFFIRYSPIQTDPTGAQFLSHTSYAVYRSGYIDDPKDPKPTWEAKPLYKTYFSSDNFADIYTVYASQNIVGLYGVAAGGWVAWTSDAGKTWNPSEMLGVGKQVVAQATSIVFPPVTPTGVDPGMVFLAASKAWLLTDGATPVPPTVGHLFRSVNGGSTFEPFHGNGTGWDLPNVPVYVVRYDPGDPSSNTIYVGTALGMYRTVDGGSTWRRYGIGLPMVAVNDIYISRNQSLIRVSTFGRGIWEIYPNSTAPQGALGDGDFDRNGRIDWADIAALASRLETTPANSVWPTYNWNLDLSSTSSYPTSVIDETDLTALMAKFGDHP